MKGEFVSSSASQPSTTTSPIIPTELRSMAAEPAELGEAEKGEAENADQPSVGKSAGRRNQGEA